MDVLGIGTGELLLIALLAMLLFGPRQLVGFARESGRAIRKAGGWVARLDADAPDERKEVREAVSELRNAGDELRATLTRPQRELENPLSIPEDYRPAASGPDGELDGDEE